MKVRVQVKIEELRSQMQEIASSNGLKDPRVLRVSEKLDALINEFYFGERRSKRGVKINPYAD